MFPYPRHSRNPENLALPSRRNRVIPKPVVNGIVPVALHLETPDRKRIVERAATNAAGEFSHGFTTPFPIPGSYRLQAFVLTGSEAGEAESDVMTISV